MCCCLTPPRNYAWSNAFGYNKLSKENYKINLVDKEIRYIRLNNLANILACCLSPLIGLIRIAVNTVFLFQKDATGTKWFQEEKQFLYTEIGRGCIELIGGGIFLWVADIALMLRR